MESQAKDVRDMFSKSKRQLNELKKILASLPLEISKRDRLLKRIENLLNHKKYTADFTIEIYKIYMDIRVCLTKSRLEKIKIKIIEGLFVIKFRCKYFFYSCWYYLLSLFLVFNELRCVLFINKKFILMQLDGVACYRKRCLFLRQFL